jgi:hypothetical protein
MSFRGAIDVGGKAVPPKLPESLDFDFWEALIFFPEGRFGGGEGVNEVVEGGCRHFEFQMLARSEMRWREKVAAQPWGYRVRTFFMLTRGSGSPTCVSRNHDQAPTSECSTGQYSSERRGSVVTLA